MDHDLELLECPGKVAVGEQIETHDEQMKDVEEMRQAKIKSLEAELRSAHLQLEKLKHKDAEQNDVIRQRDTDILRLNDRLDALQTQMDQMTEKLRSAENTRDELQARVTSSGAVAKSSTTRGDHFTRIPATFHVYSYNWRPRGSSDADGNYHFTKTLSAKVWFQNIVDK